MHVKRLAMIGRRLVLCAALWAAWMGNPGVAAQPEPGGSESAEPQPGEVSGGSAAPTGLPLPRFASLRSAPVNLRTGPGVRYPVDWVYVRKSLPMQIVAEFETWRRVRDPDGAEGWVHQSMLSGRRTAVVKPGDAAAGPQALRAAGNDQAALIASLEAGVIVTVQRCPTASAYCRVEVAGAQGWLDRSMLWGLRDDETID
ncbi:MAG: SH3 domain-containing protein [Rhodospirillaceae bacterium]|nr:SH3 domain-containing protein [Rhodospirillaceae bacterium]